MVSGDLDLSSIPDLAHTLRVELEAGHDVAVDLSRVTLFDSTALGVLWGATKRARKHGLVLALRTNASAAVMQVIEATRTGEHFTWVDEDDL